MCNVPCFLCGYYDDCKIIFKEKIKANELSKNKKYKPRSIFNLKHMPVPKELKKDIKKTIKIFKELIKNG